MQLIALLLHDVVERRALVDLAFDLVDSFEVHHVERNHAFLCPVWGEESQRIQLFRPLVLFCAGEWILLLRLDLDVKDRSAEQVIAEAVHARHLIAKLVHADLRILVGHFIRDAESARCVVELPHALDAQLHDFRLRAVARRNHIAARLVARLLQCRNSRRSRRTAGCAAVGHVAV